MNKTFSEMTDDEIIRSFQQIASRCQHANNPAEAFKAVVKKELDCQYTVAISFSSPDGRGHRMYMFMVNSPSTGETLSG